MGWKTWIGLFLRDIIVIFTLMIVASFTVVFGIGYAERLFKKVDKWFENRARRKEEKKLKSQVA